MLQFHFLVSYYMEGHLSNASVPNCAFHMILVFAQLQLLPHMCCKLSMANMLNAQLLKWPSI